MKEYEPFLIVLIDTSKRDDAGQIGYVIGLLIEEASGNSLVHTIP